MAREAIFISYRRDDSTKESAELYRAIAARVGESLLYKDVDNIPLGADFGAHIRSILPRCQIALIVIGPNWIKAKDKAGRRRLENPHDWVRIEVELALEAADSGGMRVVPLLVSGARMPRANEVSASLEPLLRRNAATVRGWPNQKTDTDRLLNALGLVVVSEMVTIPAGEFIMGSPANEPGRQESEGPQHVVHIKTFELGKYPVTFAEWDAALAAGAKLEKPKDDGWGRDRRPVINVSWRDAQDYIAWLNSKGAGGYRLPSEAEWEYACRAGTTTPYSTGFNISTSEARFNSDSTAPVGSYPPNVFGLHDMHGNIWEWCEDVRHDDYNGAPDDGSAWITSPPIQGQPGRVLRGGSWRYNPTLLRSAYRSAGGPAYRLGNDHGFRIARTL